MKASVSDTERLPHHPRVKTAVDIPAGAKVGDTIHVILEGTDDGVPALTRYQRVVITIK